MTKRTLCAGVAGLGAVLLAGTAQAQPAGNPMTSSVGQFFIAAEALYMTRSAKSVEIGRDDVTDARFFGGLDRDWKPGARLTAGLRVGARGRIEASGFFLKKGTTEALAQSATEDLDARFLGANESYPGVDITPTISAGALDVFSEAFSFTTRASSSIWGAELNYRHTLETRPGLAVDLLAGFRHLEVRDKLSMDSVDADGNPDFLGFLKLNARNRLNGIQVGFDGAYVLGQSVTLGLGARVGAFVNQAYRSRQMDIVAGGNARNEYYDTAAASGFSAMVEGGPSVTWRVHPAVTVMAGYQLLYLTGLALGRDHYLGAGLVEDRGVNHDSTLLYHGARVGAALRF